jgi:hypothetical protein
MKPFYKFLLLSILYGVSIQATGQSKVALEQIQIYSSIHPNANYWKLPDNLGPILNALDTGIFAKLSLDRDKQYSTKTKMLTKQNQVGKINVDWSASHNIPLHAYIELFEMDPDIANQNKLLATSESKKDSIHSVWFIACNIFNQKQEAVFKRTIVIGMLPIQTLGMGYRSISVTTTPTYLFDALVKGIGMLTPETADLDFMEAKVPAAYATDNYWMPYIHNQPRTLFDTTKKFISFVSKKGLELLRVPAAILNKIDLKNKTPNYPYKELIVTIKKNRANTSANEYYEVVQPLRDVHGNKDYTLIAYLEYNPDVFGNGEAALSALRFLNEPKNIIYKDKDSIGQFTVKENVKELDKFYNPNKIYNGYDSTKSFVVGANLMPEPIVHSRVIEGAVLSHPFSIQFDRLLQHKTILVDHKIIAILEGTNLPHQMVTVDYSIDNDLKNLLLLISTSEIFQSPILN